MHVKLHVGDSALKYQLDSGASHSFISSDIAKQFGLNIYKYNALEIRLADGSAVKTDEIVVVPVHFAGGAE